MNQPKIISLGEVLWDIFPDVERFGGAPANFASHAALAGGKVFMVSAVGDDARGRQAAMILGRYGVDTSLVQTIPGISTGAVGVELDKNGKPTYQIHENSAWDQIRWSDQLELASRNSDAVYFGTLGQRSELSRTTIRRCTETARSAGVPRILDINLRVPFFDDELIRDSIELASILKLSDEEISFVAAACGLSKVDDEQEILSQLLYQNSLDLVVVTRGADGATLVSKDETIQQSGFPTEVRDTVGAGDSFTATFVYGLLRGESHETSLRIACKKAAEVCGLPGAVPDLDN
ncbi:carbohydrate kinase family protein [Rubripirellula reticaptiva]|uniref:5-dehydro-2-deoxygluconokinase n=1 Tax=Rubripirellula reticaptiva TaxID=2528013 RepID=A0A5C6F6B1_9BACT|nr:carbohydrate kinase [Rubripirellula reticaptiva]TWU55606.1 5-dehydro-2-deoxygluconokinase [Rubripirellula reticaptiva]